jgi:hypothetical protein
MTLVAGTVEVDDDGNETFTPNDATNAASYLYARLKSVQESLTRPEPSFTPPVITIDRVTGASTITNGTMTTTMVPVEPSPGGSQAQAKMANTIAAWMITDILPLLVATTVIGTTSDFDGLQDGTTAPPTPKTLLGTIS